MLRRQWEVTLDHCPRARCEVGEMRHAENKRYISHINYYCPCTILFTPQNTFDTYVLIPLPTIYRTLDFLSKGKEPGHSKDSPPKAVVRP